jgi:hypothetical protein
MNTSGYSIVFLLATVACTVCDSDAGVAVRLGIFNSSFLPTLLEVMAPFPVIGVGLFLLNRYLPD